MKNNILFFVFIVFITISCNLLNTVYSSPTPEIHNVTDTILPTVTFPPTMKIISTQTQTSIPSPTVTITQTKISQSDPTNIGYGLMKAYCRLGPNKAYIPSAHSLEENSKAIIEGWHSTNDGKWYWIQIENADTHCWVHSSTIRLDIDPQILPYKIPKIPTNNAVPEPRGIKATRKDDRVILSWFASDDAPELGYLIEAGVCYDGYMINAVFYTEATSISIRYDTKCNSKSFGSLRVKNKLGYSNAVEIEWPQ